MSAREPLSFHPRHPWYIEHQRKKARAQQLAACLDRELALLPHVPHAEAIRDDIRRIEYEATVFAPAAASDHPFVRELQRLSDELLDNLVPCHNDAARRRGIVRRGNAIPTEIGLPFVIRALPADVDRQIHRGILLDEREWRPVPLRSHIVLMDKGPGYPKERLLVEAPDCDVVDRDTFRAFFGGSLGMGLNHLYRLCQGSGFPGLRKEKRGPISVTLKQFLPYWLADREVWQTLMDPA